MGHYRKKPIVVEAHYIPPLSDEITAELEEFLLSMPLHSWRPKAGSILIKTLEGEMEAAPGDWIIKEPFATKNRQFYPCKPDIFEATYEPVEAG